MKRILIIDDNLENREILGILFEDEGFEVKLLSGPDLIEAELTLFAPDAVLMDVMMDGFNGIDVCRQIKSDPLFAETKVVLMTASNALSGVELSSSMADSYVLKPFDINEVALLFHGLVEA